MSVEENDINGLELVVSANRERGEGIKLQEDDWLPCVLTGFVPFENQWGKQLRWVFEIQGEKYTWKSKDGKTGQFKVNGQSSYACSPKSKLYKWYSKLTGKEPAEGENIKLKSIVGIPCFVMIKINKGKDREGEVREYYNVDKVKARTAAPVQAAPVSTPVPAPQPNTPANPGNPVAPAVSVKETVVTPKPETKANIFDDIF